MLLGEDLVAFRDTQGNVVVANVCAHHGAPMMFGRNGDYGLRCVYHGWKFDVTGTVVDTPAEPVRSRRKDKVKITAYPCKERNGIVWTYIGPDAADPPPLQKIYPMRSTGSSGAAHCLIGFAPERRHEICLPGLFPSLGSRQRRSRLNSSFPGRRHCHAQQAALCRSVVDLADGTGPSGVRRDIHNRPRILRPALPCATMMRATASGSNVRRPPSGSRKPRNSRPFCRHLGLCPGRWYDLAGYAVLTAPISKQIPC